MTRTTWILLGALGSAGLLIGAFGFEHLGGMAPCKLCLWQRWPHGAAILIGIAALLVPGRLLPLLGAVAALSTAAIGGYHTGVERGWWEGPTTCTSGPVTGISTQDLMAQIMAAPLVRCDEIAWEMFGLTMANLNAVFSLIFAVFWLRLALIRD